MQLLNDVKQINSLNQAEKAAICAVKARVFMQYPPKGNGIALKFANQARSLDPTEPEWIIVWLKAKGRERRYYQKSKMPDEDEMNAAEMLCSTKTNPQHLIAAADIYKESAFYLDKFNYNTEISKPLYKLSSDIIKKSIELSKDDTKLLYSCLLTCVGYPEQYFSKSMMNNIIKKLSKVNNSRVDYFLGKYYYKNEKFEKPLFETDGFKPKQFLKILSSKVKGLLNHKWSKEEKNTIDRFDKISKLFYI